MRSNVKQRNTRMDDTEKCRKVAMASSEPGFKSNREPLAMYGYNIKQNPRQKRVYGRNYGSVARVIEADELKKLVSSMPKHYRLVIKNKGWPIKY